MGSEGKSSERGTADAYFLSSSCMDKNILTLVLDKLRCVAADGNTLVASLDTCYRLTVYQTATGLCLDWARRHGLPSKKLLLNKHDALVALQLCLAQKSKDEGGDFHVELSRVLELERHLTMAATAACTSRRRPALPCSTTVNTHRKTGISDCSSDSDRSEPSPAVEADRSEPSLAGVADRLELESARKSYYRFLDECDVVDERGLLAFLMDKSMSGAAEDDECCHNRKPLLFVGIPQCPIQRAFISMLCRNRRVYNVTVETSLDASLREGEVVSPEISIDAGRLEEILVAPVEPSGDKPSAATEAYVMKILIGYLRLLINSRDEMSLACIINVPERGINHAAFTELKRLARKRGMPLFQTVTSYVMRVRLGGKSYAPEQCCPLYPHISALSDFICLLNKMQTILEEEQDTGRAIQTLISVVKNALLKSKHNTLGASGIDGAVSRLRTLAQTATQRLAEGQLDDKLDIPERICGHRNVIALRELLDDAASLPVADGNRADVLTGGVASQSTPIHLPSLMSQFRSPDVCSPDENEMPLAQRLAESDHQVTAQITRPQRYGSCLTWAEPAIDAGFTQKDAIEEIHLLRSPGVCETSSTLVSRATPKNVGASRLNSDATRGRPRRNDAETELSAGEIAITASATPVSSKAGNKRVRNGQNRAKRPLPIERTAEQEIKQHKNPGACKRRKQVALLHGQKTLTDFFKR
ncbi:PREDICTED: PCNA-interacting partner-like isoform X2 [Priapulus caudatus]|uniref:PCNA-interacting partner n=1 Tax=Priapulus caudatus TaxID=37621 RepID=A0ABM1ETP7_PRICU|nr:PREDICTED: PCNA-interacting partner-like isoform X2 [Priapulus caudatus]